MRLTIPDLSLVLLVGPASSGKSTFAARHFQPADVLSLEEVRRLAAGAETSAEATAAAWEVLRSLAARRLERGIFTVVDAPLIDVSIRAPLLAIARERHFIPVAIVFALPESTCQEWNAGRPGSLISPYLISDQHQALRLCEAGLPREGIRHIYRFARTVELNAAEVNRPPLWSNRREERGPLDIVGSVHGRLRELLGLLGRLGYQVNSPSPASGAAYRIAHPQSRKLVFLGDLVGHGPQPVEVLRLVMDAVDAGTAYAVPGNHDARLLEWLRSGGGGSSPDPQLAAAVAETAAGFREQLETFLHSSVSHYVLDEGRLVVAHAGLKEELQGRGSAAVRSFAIHGEWQDECEHLAPLGGPPEWVATYQGRARVVYSHPRSASATWINGTINLCTSAGGRGDLTALRYPEMAVESIPME